MSKRFLAMIKEIVFEHVTFQYPETDNVIFDDLSLTLARGITTLVGQNGTGKTTFRCLPPVCCSQPQAGSMFRALIPHNYMMKRNDNVTCHLFFKTWSLTRKNQSAPSCMLFRKKVFVKQKMRADGVAHSRIRVRIGFRS